jgi:four helix bundle protein
MRDALVGLATSVVDEYRSRMQSPMRPRVFREAEDLTVLVYRLTRSLPSDERFGLVQQMRRAGVSIASNIAEGCGRGGTRELVRFLSIALGSATELECQLRLARRLGYINAETYEPAVEHARRLERMLTRLIVTLRPALEASRGRP